MLTRNPQNVWPHRLLICWTIIPCGVHIGAYGNNLRVPPSNDTGILTWTFPFGRQLLACYSKQLKLFLWMKNKKKSWNLQCVYCLGWCQSNSNREDSAYNSSIMNGSTLYRSMLQGDARRYSYAGNLFSLTGNFRTSWENAIYYGQTVISWVTWAIPYKQVSVYQKRFLGLKVTVPRWMDSILCRSLALREK